MDLTQYKLQRATDLDERIRAHQKAIAEQQAQGLAAGAPGTPLNLLADGDSWFDYPLGGIPFVDHTDIIAQLPGLCEIKPNILNLAITVTKPPRSLASNARKRS